MVSYRSMRNIFVTDFISSDKKAVLWSISMPFGLPNLQIRFLIKALATFDGRSLLERYSYRILG